MAKKRTIPKDTKTFKYFNANPSDNYVGDCVIRAISVALNQSWEQTYSELCMLGLNMHSMPNDKKVYTKYIENKGWIKCKQPRKSNNTKYTGKEFVKIVKGTVLAHIGGHHIVCIKDNKVLDIWDSTDGCIGNYWIKED